MRRLRGRPSRSGERGYALLIVILSGHPDPLLGTLAVSPNVLTEGKREKEQEMIWRGKQYVRGIKLYVRKNQGRFPSTLEDLEKPGVGNVRFMRHAYKDPMNKEDGSWRLIYVGPAGQLIGSLKPQQTIQLGQGGGLGTSVASITGAQAGGAQSSFEQSSFGQSSFGSSGSNSSGFGSSQSSGNSPNGFGSSQSSGSSNGFGTSGNSFGSSQNGNSSFGSSTAGPGSTIGGGTPGGAQGPGGQPGSVQPGNQPSVGASGAPGATDNAALAPGTPGASVPDDPTLPAILPDTGTVIGGRIIGIGSKVNKPSLKVYDKAKNYRLFEFIWDPSKDQQLGGGVAPAAGTGLGQPAGQNGTGFGQSNGAFGTQPGQFGQPPQPPNQNQNQQNQQPPTTPQQ